MNITEGVRWRQSHVFKRLEHKGRKFQYYNLHVGFNYSVYMIFRILLETETNIIHCIEKFLNEVYNTFITFTTDFLVIDFVNIVARRGKNCHFMTEVPNIKLHSSVPANHRLNI